VFVGLPNDSVNYVYDNYGGKGSADRAMPKLKLGGAYLVVPGGQGGRVSQRPRAGVRQITFSGTASSTHAGLDALAGLFDVRRPHWDPRPWIIIWGPELQIDRSAMEFLCEGTSNLAFRVSRHGRRLGGCVLISTRRSRSRR
jgi:hypothetical protein